MDVKPIKKDINTSMREIWNDNHPNLFELVNNNYISLNNVIGMYNLFFNKLDKLKDPKNWAEPYNEIESYEKFDSLFNKIENSLKKGFERVPFDFVSLKIDHKNDELTIYYYDYHLHSFNIKDFMKKAKKGFSISSFNNRNEPLNFSIVLGHIMYDIDSYWVKNIITYCDECNKIDYNNEIATKLNKKIDYINQKSFDRYEAYFKVIDRLKLVLPIKFINGEKIVFNKADFDNYYIVSKNNKVLFKVRGASKFDKSINTILFDKCKIDSSCIPSWITNANIFNDIKNFEKDFSLIKNDLNKLIEINKKYYESLEEISIEDVNHNNVSFLDNVSSESEKDYKNIDSSNNNSIDIEMVKNKVYNSLVKVEGRVAKKIELPSSVLFKNNEEGIKVIDERFIPYLKCIDLKRIDFNNVLVSGVDFSNCNPMLLDPQTVYDKDLSNTKFNTNIFNENTSFEDVNICDTIIILDTDKNINFSGAIGNANTYVCLNDCLVNINGYTL